MNLIKKASESERRSRINNQATWISGFFERSPQVTFLLLFTFTLLTLFTCFYGQSPLGPVLLPKQIARTRIVSEFAFTYESKEQTLRLKNQRIKQVPPVYRLDLTPYADFEKAIQRLVQEFQALAPELEGQEPPEQVKRMDALLFRLESETGYLFNSEDCLTLMREQAQDFGKALFSEGLITLKEIFREGIVDTVSTTAEGKANFGLVSVFKDAGNVHQVTFQSEEEVIRFLRVNIAALDIERALANTLFRILKVGIKPNLVYDPDATEAEIDKAIQNLAPVLVRVEKDETLIESGSRVSQEQYEKLQAYRKQFNDNVKTSFVYNLSLIERLFMALVLLIAALILVKVNLKRFARDNYRLSLMILVILVNLVIIRLILQLGESSFGASNATLTALLPLLAPVNLGPLLITILLGMRPAIVCAIILSGLSALIQNSSLEVFIISLLACLVGTFFCQQVRVRTKVIRAGFLSGLVIGLCACILGYLRELEWLTIGQQLLTGVMEGTLTGMIALGLLPLMEGIFNYTTEISLLELTDFNHPLLRRIQVEAPGTYHHSIMVANLSENAAAKLGLSAIACRACALFHDIGKLVKPAYFIENQREGLNPHKDCSPSMSALLIKSHVKEGIDIAQKHKLPKIVRDVIEQHHGTSLIRYFYDKACRQLKESEGETSDARVDPNTYRYDGPKPQFVESAIISLADSVEAASRTLLKVSHQGVCDLVNRIVAERIEDDQLSDCPITFSEINEIKNSFVLTLMSMLHNRVEYPKGKSESDAKNDQAQSSQEKKSEGRKEN